MRGRSFVPDEATKAKIVAGLIELRKAGHFYALHINRDTVRLQYEFDGPHKLIGWRRGWQMIQEAALKAAGQQEVERKPAASERSQLAQRVKASN